MANYSLITSVKLYNCAAPHDGTYVVGFGSRGAADGYYASCNDRYCSSKFDISDNYRRDTAEQIITSMYCFLGYGSAREVFKLPEVSNISHPLLKKWVFETRYEEVLQYCDIRQARQQDLAEAMAEGDTDKVFAAQKKHLDSVEKKIREEALKGTPKPTGGSGKNAITKEQFRAMSAQERYDFSQSHPDEYKELYGGN